MKKFLLNAFLIGLFLAFPSFAGDWSNRDDYFEETPGGWSPEKTKKLIRILISNEMGTEELNPNKSLCQEQQKKKPLLPDKCGEGSSDGSLSPMDISCSGAGTSTGYMSLESSIIETIETSDLSETIEKLNHVALIADGSRRWAKQHEQTNEVGYRKCLDNLPKILDYGFGNGIHTMTLVLLSDANVNERPEDQLKIIYQVSDELLDLIWKIAKSREARIIHMGRKDRIPYFLSQKISKLETNSEKFDQHICNVAIDYGGRQETVKAIREIITLNPPAEKITEELIDGHMYTKQQKYPDPDFIIRTGDSKRLSGLMSWQSKYSELLFLDQMLPDFNVAQFRDALIDFGKRERPMSK